MSEAEAQKTGIWTLRLYVAGRSPKALEAFSNLKRICTEHLDGRYEIEIVDVKAEPHRAKEDSIVALPTLVRRLPPPIRKIIGDLSNEGKVLVALDLHSGRA